MQIIAVTNNRLANPLLVDILLQIEASIDAVILREKSKTDAEVIDLIQQLKEEGFDASKIIVHGRTEIALHTGITKVQLPGHGAPLALAKKHFPDMSFGRSVHSFKEAETAYKEGADWLLYGHLFTTASKEGLPPRGTVELAQIIKTLPLPVYAIGGIQPCHLPLVQQTGVSGIAVMSTIFNNVNPLEAATAYQKELIFMKRTIELNGNPYDVPIDVKNVQELLSHLGLADRVAIVEMNRDILAKDTYNRPINDRDQIEIIHFVGGG